MHRRLFAGPTLSFWGPAGANIVILKLLGFQAATRLVLALCRDVRRLVGRERVSLFFASGIRRIPASAELRPGRDAVQ
jgi:hypothetical protein